MTYYIVGAPTFLFWSPTCAKPKEPVPQTGTGHYKRGLGKRGWQGDSARPVAITPREPTRAKPGVAESLRKRFGLQRPDGRGEGKSAIQKNGGPGAPGALTGANCEHS